MQHSPATFSKTFEQKIISIWRLESRHFACHWNKKLCMVKKKFPLWLMSTTFQRFGVNNQSMAFSAIYFQTFQPSLNSQVFVPFYWEIFWLSIKILFFPNKVQKLHSFTEMHLSNEYIYKHPGCLMNNVWI